MADLKKNGKLTHLSDEILVVEDSRVVQNMIQKTLMLTAYRTVVAREGKQALKLISEKEGLFRAVLLDILMPVMNGIDTIQAIRKMTGNKADTTVIAVTGNHDEYSSRDFQILGFNAVIIKPLDCNQILSLLERLADPAADRWLGVLSYDGRLTL